jgi:hypothetical protein
MSISRYDKQEPDLFIVQAFNPYDEDGYIEVYGGTDDVDRAHSMYHELCMDMEALCKSGIMTNDIVVQLTHFDGHVAEERVFSVAMAKAVLQ